MSYQKIHERLARGETILLDGGIGTEVLRRGVYWRCHGIERKPDVVRQIHADYIEAGADVIKTNTFQLNRRAYTSLFHGLDHMRHIGPAGLEHKAGKLVGQAVELAREARRQAGKENDGVAIAGVISPLEHSFRPDLVPPPDQCRAEHAEIVGQMKAGGVDFILFESMNSISEARAACEAARDSGLPVWVSFVVREGARLLSKESIADAVKAVEPLGVEVIAVNCAPIEDITTGLTELCKHRKGPVGAFAHIGRYDPPSWKFGFYPRFSGTEQVPPAKYLEAAREWKRLGAQVIGGCCGTTPEHIRALRKGKVEMAPKLDPARKGDLDYLVQQLSHPRPSPELLSAFIPLKAQALPRVTPLLLSAEATRRVAPATVLTVLGSSEGLGAMARMLDESIAAARPGASEDSATAVDDFQQKMEATREANLSLNAARFGVWRFTEGSALSPDQAVKRMSAPPPIEVVGGLDNGQKIFSHALRDPDANLRLGAIALIRAATGGKDFGYKVDSEPDLNEAAIQEITTFLTTERAKVIAALRSKPTK